jgi:hypothetical protein
MYLYSLIAYLLLAAGCGSNDHATACTGTPLLACSATTALAYADPVSAHLDTPQERLTVDELVAPEMVADVLSQDIEKTLLGK